MSELENEINEKLEKEGKVFRPVPGFMKDFFNQKPS